MTFDFEAHEAAGLLQAAYLRKGSRNVVKVIPDVGIIVATDEGIVTIQPDFALFTAKLFWDEILNQP